MRIIIFLSLSFILFFLEFCNFYRTRNFKRWERQIPNFLLIFLSSVLIKLIVPITLVDFAFKNGQNGAGIGFIAYQIFCFILLDLIIYFQHRFFHFNNFLWKLHRVHHSDIDLDFTSALRFHPIEILISLMIKFLAVYLFEINYMTVIIFEIVLNGMAMFNHANIFIPNWAEKKLRLFIVTPQMHLVHHSVQRKECDSNFGFNFSFWDRIFKTYIDKMENDEKIGQFNFRDKKEQNIFKLLIQPFK